MKFLRPFILVFACVMALVAGQAFAQQDEEMRLRDGRAQGLVGETARGYVAPVATPTPEVTQLVNRVNEARRKRYDEIARANKVPLSEIEVLAAQKIFERVPSGTYVQGPSGWTRKR